MRVRILSCDECPNTRATETIVKAALEALGVHAQLDFVQVGDDTEAAEHHFLGSPTIQVDGRDIESERRADVAHFGCRLYVHGKRRRGVPPMEMVLKALMEARDVSNSPAG